MTGTCVASGNGWACDRNHTAQSDLCKPHQLQRTRGKPLKPLRAGSTRPAGTPPPTCHATGHGWECDRPSEARGYCRAHYAQIVQRGLDPVPLGTSRTRKKTPPKTCRATGDGWACDRPAKALGLCSGHHYQHHQGIPDNKMWQIGNPPPKPRKTKGKCPVTVDDWECGRPIESRGLCQRHAKQDRAGEPFRVIGSRARMTEPCWVTVGEWRCGRPPHAHGLCSHHARQHSAGEPFRVIGAPKPARPTPERKPRRKPAARKTPEAAPVARQQSEPWIPGTLRHRPPAPRLTRKIDDMGESQLYHIPPLTRTQIGQALHALTNAGATPSDLPMLHRMLTEDVPLAYDQLTKTRRKRPA